jgi:hypothetical protein
MRTKFFAAILGCCTLTFAAASDRKIPTTGLQDFQGKYDLVDGRVLTITQRGQRLIMQLDNQPEAEVVEVGSAVFVAKFGGKRLEFVQYPNGTVPAVRVIDNSGTTQPGYEAPASDLRKRSSLEPKNVSSPSGVPLSRIN